MKESGGPKFVIEFGEYGGRFGKKDPGRRRPQPARRRRQGMGSELGKARAHYGLHVSRPRRLYVDDRDFESVAECHRSGCRVCALHAHDAVFQKVVAFEKGEGEVTRRLGKPKKCTLQGR